MGTILAPFDVRRHIDSPLFLAKPLIKKMNHKYIFMSLAMLLCCSSHAHPTYPGSCLGPSKSGATHGAVPTLLNPASAGFNLTVSPLFSGRRSLIATP